MVRNRVLSFVSQLSAGQRQSRSPTPSLSPPPSNFDEASRVAGKDVDPSSLERFPQLPPDQTYSLPLTPPRLSPTDDGSISRLGSDVPLRRRSTGRERSTSRPNSIVLAYQPPLMEIDEDTIPELQPIFTFLNNHGNKLYQEGYFLKLDDQNTQGRPNPDRTWHECFAQLVGTVLSLWDAAELDAAGDDGEVLPKFINITDASIKMLESLQISSDDSQGLLNVLSISTAGRNRYLLHFNSHHSLVQWTAAIRLAMFEHSTLQEAYTGALIAGKARMLNNINVIMDRATLPSEEWVRVRFGAGVPWRRCWCVITPPSLKDIQKMQKDLKKRSPYDRRAAPNLKGDIKFYDTRVEGRKQKKARPIASITDAFSAYAIYPQAKSLIDVSTLIKIEGNITVHSQPPSATEGFVFIMPEIHPAVSGLETLLQFLFPAWDTFALYGRPGKLVASVLDTRSLMFAMPKHKRYGYLEILDVSGLISTAGSDQRLEREWRKSLKELTGQRMTAMDAGRRESRSASRNGRNSVRLSFSSMASPTPPKPRVGFTDDRVSVRSARSYSLSGPPIGRVESPDTMSSDPDQAPRTAAAVGGASPNLASRYQQDLSDTDLGSSGPDVSPIREGTFVKEYSTSPSPVYAQMHDGTLNGLADRFSSDEERLPPMSELEVMRKLTSPQPVEMPPAFSHAPQDRPAGKPFHSPELRRANSRLSSTTLSQLAKAGRVAISMNPNAEASRAQGGSEFAYDSGMNSMSRPHLPPLVAMPVSPPITPLASPPNGTPKSFQPYHGSVDSREVGGPDSSAGSGSGLGPYASVQLPDPRSSPNFIARSSSPGPAKFPGPGQISVPTTRPYQSPYQQSQPRPQIVAHTLEISSRAISPSPPPPPPPPPPHLSPYAARDGEWRPGPGGMMPSSRAGFEPYVPEEGAFTRKTPASRTATIRREHEQQLSRSTSLNSMSSHLIDQSALDKVLPSYSVQSSEKDRADELRRRDSEKSASSSYYDDGSPTDGSGHSIPGRVGNMGDNRDDRARPGALRTVGRAIGANDGSGRAAGVMGEPSEYEVPDIDFGNTLQLTPTYSRLQAQMGQPRLGQVAASDLSLRPGQSERRHVGHDRQGSDDTIKRMGTWQPELTSNSRMASTDNLVERRVLASSNGPQRAMTPNSGPVYRGEYRRDRSTGPYDGHMRRHSSIDLRNGQQAPYASGQGDSPPQPSAKEQEYMACLTGTPLLGASMGGNRPNGPLTGLVGEIESRERGRALRMLNANSQAALQGAAAKQRQYEMPPQQPQQTPLGDQSPFQQQRQARPEPLTARQMMPQPLQYGQQSQIGSSRYPDPPTPILGHGRSSPKVPGSGSGVWPPGVQRQE